MPPQRLYTEMVHKSLLLPFYPEEEAQTNPFPYLVLHFPGEISMTSDVSMALEGLKTYEGGAMDHLVLAVDCRDTEGREGRFHQSNVAQRRDFPFFLGGGLHSHNK